MAKINEFDVNNTYHKNDYCSYNGYLCVCTKDTTGPGEFETAAWLSLGYILKDKGYVVSDEEDITYRNDEYLNISGGTLTGNLKFNIGNETTGERQPFAFAASDTGSDTFILRGGNDSVVLTSSNIFSDKSKLINEKFSILPGSSEIDVISKGIIKVFTGAESTEQAQKAVQIDRTGDIHIKSKEYVVLGNNNDLIATEAQVYQMGEERLQIKKETREGIIYSKIEVPTEYTQIVDNNSGNNTITNKKYVDDSITTATTNITSATDTKLTNYLKLTGGTIKGPLQIDNATGSLIVPSKNTDPSNNATSVATEAQLYKVNNTLSTTISTNDTKTVHKAGTETITGTKTFSSVPVFAGGVTTTEGGEIHLAPTNNDSTTNTKGIIDVLGTGSSERIRLRFEGKEGLSVYKDNTVKLASTPAATVNGTEVVSAAWVNNNITNNTSIVHIGGTETITGNKTFTGNTLIKANTPQIKYQSTAMDITNTNFAAGRNTIAWAMDKNGNESGGIYNYTEYNATSGVKNTNTSMYAYNRTTGSAIMGSISIQVDKDGNKIGWAPTPGANNTSTVTKNSQSWIATTGWVNNPSLSTNVVHRTNDETIAGTKSFSNTIKVINNNIAIYDNNLDTTIAPGEYHEKLLLFYDKNGSRMGSTGFSQSKDQTSVRCYIAASKKVGDTYKYSVIEAWMDENGNAWATAPTPSVDQNNARIATTAYINNKFQKVSSLPSNPDANTWYAIPES